MSVADPKTTENHDGENVLKENYSGGASEEWIRVEIERKFRATLGSSSAEVDIEVNKECMDKLDVKTSEEKVRNDALLSDIKTSQSSIDSTNGMIQSFAEYRQSIMERMKVMSLCVEKQIEPRINHSLKLNSGLMRQIEELKTATEKIEESHKAEMANKVQEWEFCKNQISEVLEKSTEIQQHFDQIAAENEQENMKIGPLKTGLSEAQEAIRKIEYMSGSITQLTSEIEAQNDVVKNLHNNAEMTQIKMESSLARIEQFKFDWDVAEAQKSFLSKRLDEIHRLMDFVSSKTETIEMEGDPIFNREIVQRSYFMEHKEKLAQENADNIVINGDLTRHINLVQEQVKQIEDAEKNAYEVEVELAKQQAELDDLESDMKAIQERLNKAQEEEEKLNQEINYQTTELDRENDDHERLKGLYLKNIVQWDLELKQEETKTRKAREQQKEMKVNKTLTSSVSKGSGNYGMLSQFLQQNISPLKNFLSQPNPPSAKSSQSSRKSFPDSISSSSQKLSLASQAITSPVPKATLKRRFQGADSNQQDVPDESARKLFRTVTNSEASTDSSPKRKVPIPTQRSALLPLTKENLMLIELPTAGEEEKAFDSDESSMNVTFNTDIDSMLE